MAALIALGTAPTTFLAGEFTVAAGTPKYIFLNGDGTGSVPSGCLFELAKKNAAGQYMILATLDESNYIDLGEVKGTGTYALRRASARVSCGADIE